jgi:hypothetical protein
MKKVKNKKTKNGQEGFISLASSEEDIIIPPDPDVGYLYMDKAGVLWLLSNGILSRQDGFGGVIIKKFDITENKKAVNFKWGKLWKYRKSGSAEDL